MNDVVIGEFIINYILNILNAKKEFSSIETPSALERRLLYGNTFSAVDHIEENGLHDLYNLLSRYGSDSSYRFAVRRSRKKKASVDPETEKLRKEKERQERALQRLQDLYLYSDSALSEKDFIIKKGEISKSLKEVNEKLGLVCHDAGTSLSDEDFIRQASHLLISRKLSDRKYIYFRELATSVSPEILKTYLDTILDSILLIDGHVGAIKFKNGLTHKFIYK